MLTGRAGVQGVNIYLDEAGMLKKLPLNARASELALKCGFNPPPTFYGDVYVGRVSSGTTPWLKVRPSTVRPSTHAVTTRPCRSPCLCFCPDPAPVPTCSF
jgi:hypothetical protein